MKKYGALLNLEKVSDFWHGPGELLGDFVQGLVVDDEAFSIVSFRYDDDQSRPAGMTTVYDLHPGLVDFILLPVSFSWQ